MCVVCGCGSTDLHESHAPVQASVTGLHATRTVSLQADLLGANQRLANRNRQHFAAHGVTAFNLMSSPGSGKTTLLCGTVAALRERRPDLPLAVIEGDQQTSRDAERIRAAGAPAIQVNTGQGCHLDAQMVGDAFEQLDLHARSHRQGGAGALLFIENVGNLVCPALWDLGEAAKVAILSVTEGDDKPIKYPDMFAVAELMVINKTDLLPYVDFDVERCIGFARRVNPRIEVLQVSATKGYGMDAWLRWLQQPEAVQPHPA
jgi:hydrogenase nickel incorporation protein HypB